MRVGRNRFRLPRLIDRIGMVAMETLASEGA
jgi:hypothetical protein